MSNYVLRIGEVTSVVDDASGLRIKAKINKDGSMKDSEVPYAFPLLPKTFQVVPKIGEAVLIINSDSDNTDSNRFYIGPIISQPQNFNFDGYNSANGIGSSISLLQGAATNPLKNIERYSVTNGAFPKKEDVAIVGRKSEDIILKEGEIDLRCGIREPYPNVEQDKNLVGDIIFNNINPAYIQMKYAKSIGHSPTQEADSVINLVADKINFISHKDMEKNVSITDNNELIKKEDIDKLMGTLHNVPYGDILIDILNVFRNAILFHVHPISGLPPCMSSEVENLEKLDLGQVLSPNIRIS